MTSVPKPLKFLRKHYDKLKQFYEGEKLKANSNLLSHDNGKTKMLYADILSVLAAVKSPPKPKKTEEEIAADKEAGIKVDSDDNVKKDSDGDVEMKDTDKDKGDKK